MQNIRVIDVGGRPPKTHVKGNIIDIVSKLKRALPKQVYNEYDRTYEETISYNTIKKYMELMSSSENESLKRVRINNENAKRKIYLYEVAMEKSSF